MVLMQQGFEVAVAAFGIKEEIADEGNAGARLDIERQGADDRLRGFGPRRGLEVEVVFGELRVLVRSCFVSLGIFSVFYWLAFFLGMIGELMSARSTGFTPLTSPPKLKLLGW
jgi:hypothetical protein